MKKTSASNSLRAGELSSLEYAAPMTDRYKSGCEYVDGFDIGEKGLTPMKVPAPDESDPAYKYRAHQWEELYYLRNTTVESLDNDSLTEDTGYSDAPTLSAKIATLVAAENFLSALTDTTDSEYSAHRKTGIFTVQQAMTMGIIVDESADATDRILILTEDTTIYRGFQDCPAIGDADAISGSWGVHGKRRIVTKVTKSGTDVNDTYYGNTTTSSDTTTYGGVRGTGSVSKTSSSTFATDKDTSLTIKVQVEEYLTIYSKTLAAGIYQIDETVQLVGRPKMFDTLSDSTQPRTYPASKSASTSNGGSTVSVSVTLKEDRSWVDDASDNDLILFWGDASDAASAFEFFAYTKLSTEGTSSFAFTGQTLISGSRRFGPCVYSYDSSLFGATATGLMGGTNDEGREISDTITAASAYFFKVPGGTVWFEECLQGILIGTPDAEYLLSGHQVNPNSSGATFKKISTIGSPGSLSYKVSLAANLAGDVFYASNLGITTLAFSTEAQSYLPRHFELRGLRCSGQSVTSIAASKTERALYFTTSGNEIWKLWPAVGAAAKVPYSLPDGATLDGVFSRDGDVYLLFTIGTTDHYCKVANAIIDTCTLKTTAFGRIPESRTQVRRISVSGMGLVGGEVSLDGETWISVPLTSDDLEDGFTGTKTWLVSDRPSKPGRGKPIWFRWQINEMEVTAPGTLEAISVEMEV